MGGIYSCPGQTPPTRSRGQGGCRPRWAARGMPAAAAPRPKPTPTYPTGPLPGRRPYLLGALLVVQGRQRRPPRRHVEGDEVHVRLQFHLDSDGERRPTWRPKSHTALEQVLERQNSTRHATEQTGTARSSSGYPSRRRGALSSRTVRALREVLQTSLGLGLHWRKAGRRRGAARVSTSGWPGRSVQR